MQVKQLGLCDYGLAWRAMQAFTAARGCETRDELWLVEHPPVYTLGMNASREHLLVPGATPVIPVDRGGQVTYHGPGQMVAYVMLDLRRLGIGVRRLVRLLEQSVIDWLAARGVCARARRDAPGVYVDDAKIAALGLRVRRGCSYHGLSLNVDMDLEPFARINPCGYRGLRVTQLRDLGIDLPVAQVAAEWVPGLISLLGFRTYRIKRSEGELRDVR
ncbi:MAG: lipoyl(octanoyl) transferase LipB [Gammaproteobacteria bacterium]